MSNDIYPKLALEGVATLRRGDSQAVGKVSVARGESRSGFRVSEAHAPDRGNEINLQYNFIKLK